MEIFILIFMLSSILCFLCCEIIDNLFEIKYHNEIEVVRTKRLIRKLTRKYMKLYKKEIKEPTVISMRDYVLDLVQEELTYKEQLYVKTLYKKYESERQYLPKA